MRGKRKIRKYSDSKTIERFELNLCWIQVDSKFDVFASALIFTLFRRRQRLVIEILWHTQSMTAGESVLTVGIMFVCVLFCCHRDSDKERIKMASNKSKLDLLVMARFSYGEAGI